MKIEKKINSLSRLGKEILKITHNNNEIIHRAWKQNPWFVPEFILKALGGISYLLNGDKLKKWILNYDPDLNSNRNIGIIMAGNIPLVGFHDLISVLLSNNRAIIKLSHNDDVLIPYLIKILRSIDPVMSRDITFVDTFDKVDAVIATGSDNTARYFKYTFKKTPHIIRKNRTSCGIIDAQEQVQDLMYLSDDIFSYFGLGCRNISKIYIPFDYDIDNLVQNFNNYSWILKHSKYNNNYRYLLSKYPLENKSFINADYFTFIESEDLVSPIACIYYEKYKDIKHLELILERNISKIQCIVSREAWFPGSIPFGKAQLPEPWDYADNVATMAFLESV
jgi:hypothetical protein